MNLHPMPWVHNFIGVCLGIGSLFLLIGIGDLFNGIGNRFKNNKEENLRRRDDAEIH